MKDKINKRLVVLMLVWAVLMAPLPSTQVAAQAGQRDQTRADNCRFAKNMGFLFAMGGFSVAFIPGAQPLVIAYGAAALIAKGYEFVNQC